MLGFFAVLFAAIGAGCMWFARNIGQESRLMAATQTSNAKGLKGLPAGTLVELKGHLRTASPIEAEFSKERCLYHLSLIEEEHEVSSSSSSSSTDTREVHRNERWTNLWLEDASGQCPVVPAGAKVEALAVLDRKERAGMGGFSINIAGVGIGSSLRSTRHTESIIRPDQPIYILGSLLESGAVGTDPAKRNPFIISVKSEDERVRSNASSRLALFVAAAAFLVGTVILGYFAWVR